MVVWKVVIKQWGDGANYVRLWAVPQTRDSPTHVVARHVSEVDIEAPMGSSLLAAVAPSQWYVVACLCSENGWACTLHLAGPKVEGEPPKRPTIVEVVRTWGPLALRAPRAIRKKSPVDQARTKYAILFSGPTNAPGLAAMLKDMCTLWVWWQPGQDSHALCEETPRAVVHTTTPALWPPVFFPCKSEYDVMDLDSLESTLTYVLETNDPKDTANVYTLLALFLQHRATLKPYRYDPDGIDMWAPARSPTSGVDCEDGALEMARLVREFHSDTYDTSPDGPCSPEMRQLIRAAISYEPYIVTGQACDDDDELIHHAWLFMRCRGSERHYNVFIEPTTRDKPPLFAHNPRARDIADKRYPWVVTLVDTRGTNQALQQDGRLGAAGSAVLCHQTADFAALSLESQTTEAELRAEEAWTKAHSESLYISHHA